jgi:hypothetical protein
MAIDTARRTGPSRTQRGSILVPVLFLLTISAVVVPVVLLSVGTNLRVSRIELPEAAGANQTPAQQTDNADLALASGLELLRDPASLCGENSPTGNPLGSNPDGSRRVFSYGGFKFILGCEFTGYTTGGLPTVYPDEGQPAVVLVGNNYNSYKGISKKDWQGDLGGSYGNPWSTALGSAFYNGYAGDLAPNGQLVHFGKAPLVVGGGVQVKRKISAANTQPLGAPGGSPAMQAAGPVIQGGSSFIDPASRYPSGSPNRCGVLEPNDQYGKAAVDVVAGSGGALAPMECGSATIAGRTEAVPGVTADGPVWNNATIAQRKKPILDKNGNPTTDCGSYSGRKDPAANTGDLPVIELEGAFGPAETKILNDWFRTCRATWQFVGDTFFDVYDPTQTDARKHSLVLDLYESNYVVGGFGSFAEGQPLPMSAFPNACDRTSPPAINGEVQTRGATITLSSRTGLRHNSGRVAICGPKQTGNSFHKTAIYQQRANDLTNWSPALQDQVLNSAVCGTCVSFTQSGSTYQATTSGNSGFARLRFATADAALQDGHLPLNLASLQANLTVNTVTTNLFSTSPTQNGSHFRVKFRFPRPRYRFINPVSGRTPDFLECWSAYQPLTLGSKTVSLSQSGGSCLYRNADGTTQGAPTEVAIGEAVKYLGRCNAGAPFPLNTSTPDPNDRIDADAIEQACSPQLDVEVQLTRNSTQTGNLTTSISNVSLVGSTTTGFTTPLGPLSVRWAPRPLNNDGTNKPGDATFNVFGSVVLPYNAVEVRWGPNGRALGTSIFNGGEVPAQNCSYTNLGACRPAVVAGALASWTTQGDAAEAKCATCGSEEFIRDDYFPNWPEGAGGVPLQPDLLAGNSDGRPAQRNYRLTACVVGDDRGTPTTADDLVYPRSWVNAYTQDVQTGLSVAGRPTVVTATGVINQDGSFLQVGNCTRPSEYP